MILVFGGAYQGKLDYAVKNFDVKTVWDCEKRCAYDARTTLNAAGQSDTMIDLSKASAKSTDTSPSEQLSSTVPEQLSPSTSKQAADSLGEESHSSRSGSSLPESESHSSDLAADSSEHTSDRTPEPQDGRVTLHTGLPDFSCDAVYKMEAWVKSCAYENLDATELLKESREAWRNSVLIMNDVSQGVVPMDAFVRRYREMNGRVITYLAGEAEQVVRIFCGIGKRVK